MHEKASSPSTNHPSGRLPLPAEPRFAKRRCSRRPCSSLRVAPSGRTPFLCQAPRAEFILGGGHSAFRVPLRTAARFERVARRVNTSSGVGKKRNRSKLRIREHGTASQSEFDANEWSCAVIMCKRWKLVVTILQSSLIFMYGVRTSLGSPFDLWSALAHQSCGRNKA